LTSGTFYTRAGRLVVDGRGDLATDQGAVVLGANGAPIRVGATDGVQIAADGTVTVSGRVVGRLRLVTVRAGTVVPAGGTVYRLGPGTRPIPGGTLTPGALAQSNVDPARLLADLVTLVGQYQADEESAHTLAQTFQQFLTAGVAP
jgi:flagellar basal body rod protein FlgG